MTAPIPSVTATATPPTTRWGKLKFLMVLCYSVALVGKMTMDIVRSPGPQCYSDFHRAPITQGRTIQYMNDAQPLWLSSSDIETTCPPLFFQTMNDSSEDTLCEVSGYWKTTPDFYLELASQQSELGSLIKRVKEIGYQNLKSKPLSLGGTAGVSLITDASDNPIGIFKPNPSLGEHIARRIIASNTQIPQVVPEVAQAYFSKKSDSLPFMAFSCQPGELVEYVPHEQQNYKDKNSYTLDDFKNVPIASWQVTAFLHLLMNHRDGHIANVIPRPDGWLSVIDFDLSLFPSFQFDFAQLIRSESTSRMPHEIVRPIVYNHPFWMDTKLVNQVLQPYDSKIAEWILSLDIRNTIGTLNPPVSDFLQTRLAVIKAAIRHKVPLPDLYAYLTPYRGTHYYKYSTCTPFDGIVETILEDYTAAIKLARESFPDPEAQSDETLRAAFHKYFEQIVSLRVQGFVFSSTGSTRY